jgi:hypothetical protein
MVQRDSSRFAGRPLASVPGGGHTAEYIEKRRAAAAGGAARESAEEPAGQRTVMTIAELAVAGQDLSRLAESAPDRCLERLVELAAQYVPGCAGATCSVWHDADIVAMSASHPDLADLLACETAGTPGPVRAAVLAKTAVSCPDMLAEWENPESEPRWAGYAMEALRLGVRCVTTLVHQRGGDVVGLALYGVRPGSLDPEATPMASLLAAVGSAAVATAAQRDESERSASQLQEAVSSRATVDQAKGLLMQALGCDAEQALERLRHLSQTRNVKVHDIARWLLDEHSRVGTIPR